MTYDVRSIANFVLDLAESKRRGLSNFEINKIVFFLHAHNLVENEMPLVSAKIEAWQHGPVFRELFREFSKFKDGPISARATRIDPQTGHREACVAKLGQAERMFLCDIAEHYIVLSFRELYAVAHERGGPWDQVWNHSGSTNAAMKISDENIKKWFRGAPRH